MNRPYAMARFTRAWPLAGALATALSILVLAAAALMQGQPAWLPLNATTHAIHGPDAAAFRGIDLAHTGLGLLIHVVSAFFWASVAVLLVRLSGASTVRLAWAVGLVTAVLAGVVDYGLMPSRLTPGWELILPPAGVAAGLAALGVGVAVGLVLARRGGRHWSKEQAMRSPPRALTVPPVPPPYPQPRPADASAPAARSDLTKGP